MEESTGKPKLLPENAYRPLEAGETYRPVVTADRSPPETTFRAIFMGCVGVVVFTFAAAYIGLKAGNVIETAIPIAILAVFFGKMFSRKNTLLENVIVQSVGGAAGVVVAGAVFTIPAMYLLNLDVNFVNIFLACCIGGFLGVVLIIPLRKFFCKEEHGNLPFPEATATTEILCSGESGSGGGKTLLLAFGLGFLFDFCIEVFHFWDAGLSTSKILLGRFGAWMSTRYRMTLDMQATAALFGLGYIIGIRYAAVICAGSVLANLVLVPMVYYLGADLLHAIPPGTVPIGSMEAADIFTTYIRPIGIGAIAMAGMISIAKMSKIIVGSFSLGFKGIFAGSKTEAGSEPRTNLDIHPRNVILLEVLFTAVMFVIFFYVANWQLVVALIGTAVTAVLAFLFTPVAARAIAIVGVNPVSGMTMITMIIACSILATTGLSGPAGQMTVLIIGCAVCTALSTSGAFISDLKIGYWLGSTPRRQQRWKFLGIVVASICVGIVIDVLAKGYGFVLDATHPDPLPAPQGNLMKTIVETTLVPNANPPWLLYGFGAAIAVMLEMTKLPALAFALGIYLPMYINLPVLAGGFAAWLLQATGRKPQEKSERKNQGILVASGLVAGAAIAGVVSAILKTIDQKDIKFGPIEMNGCDGAIDRTLNFSKSFTAMVSNVWEATEKAWYEHYGTLLGLCAIVGLGVLCHFIAVRAAKKQMKEE